MVPAHQRFHAHDGAGHAVALGLQKEAELVVFKGPFQLAEQLALLFEVGHHGWRKAVHAAHGRAGVHRRDLRIVAKGLRVRIRLLGHRAQTDGQVERDVLLAGVRAGLKLADHGQLLFAVVRQAQHKIIVAKVAHRRVGGLGVLQQEAGQRLQQALGLLGTVQLVVQFEMLDIDGGNTPVLVLMGAQKLLQLVQKIVFASDLRKHIGLRSTDGLVQFHFFGHKNPSLSDFIG